LVVAAGGGQVLRAVESERQHFGRTGRQAVSIAARQRRDVNQAVFA
jgi:hypothetical protein